MKKPSIIELALSMWIFFLPAILFGQVKEEGMEYLLFEEIPAVFAASQRLQPITETASSVEIITAEDIKQSGALNIADVLRKIAGIQVKEPSVSSHAIGIRGLPYTQQVLVTLDGNSTYLHHVNHIYVDFIPIDLEEIERIEIVKGPGAVFYGGSAFSGVINIVTKIPKPTDGTQVNLVGGNWETFRGNIIHGGGFKSWNYNFGIGYRRCKYMSPPRATFMKPHTYTYYLASKVDYHLNKESTISTGVRYSYSDDAISRMCASQNTYVSLRYDAPNFWIRGFYNRQYKECFERAISVDDRNYELETMKLFRWGKNITSIGGFGRRVFFTGGDLVNNIQSKSDIKDYAVKLENEYRPIDQFIITLGGRIEYFSELEFVGSGRSCIVYTPTEDHHFRLSVGNGYYLPSVAQLYGGGDAIPLFLGNLTLQEEKIISYELSYYGYIAKWVRLNTAIFYHKYRDLIANRDGLAPPENEIDGDKQGFELSCNFMLTNWLTGFLNYTYQTIYRTDIGDREVDPKHMFNFAFQTKIAEWSTNLILHYVDTYYEICDHANPVLGLLDEPQKVDSYTTVDVRIAYTPTNYLEFAVASSNLLRDIHYESNPIGLAGADEIDRRVTAGVSYKF
jgi:outer membrane receptor for ferrienterochelin and colicin